MNKKIYIYSVCATGIFYQSDSLVTTSPLEPAFIYNIISIKWFMPNAEIYVRDRTFLIFGKVPYMCVVTTPVLSIDFNNLKTTYKIKCHRLCSSAEISTTRHN